VPPPPPPQQGNSLPSPVDIPDIFVITGGSWDSDAEAYIRSRISEGCGDLGPSCVDYAVVEEPDTEVEWTVDCPILQIRIPRPLYDADVAGTPHRDDLITIVINDPCDGVIASAPVSAPATG
jgi:hypothetical protein